jgi:hypothetical protein
MVVLRAKKKKQRSGRRKYHNFTEETKSCGAGFVTALL